MRLSIVKNVGLLVLAVVGIASRADAGIITVPPGLAPGSQYRLVFVTDNDYTATSSSITDYNNDVNSEANSVAALAALGTTWLDIGSTATVNAIDNIGVDSGAPIYDLEGDLVANDAGTEAGGMFSGSLLYPIETTETGAPSATDAWTGTDPAGSASPCPLGDVACGGGTAGARVTYGEIASDDSWLDDGASPGNNLAPYYGISGILIVSAAPEPSSLGMAIGGAALMCIARRRYRRATRTNP